MRFHYALIVCTLLVVPPAFAAAQTDDLSPPWVYLKLGEKAFREQEYGEALRNFRTALGKQGVYPEAEVGLGMVFQEEGEYGLAETHYLTAVGHRSAFSVPGDYFETLYRLSEIYGTQRKYRDFEETLLKVLMEDRLHTEPEQKVLFSAIGRAVHERSLDKVVELYRSPVDFSLRAYRDLGVFYYETGRYVHAVQNLTVAAVKVFTAALDELRRLDPDYRYTNVSATLDLAMKNPAVRDFVMTQDLYRILYYLGASLYAETRNTSVRSIWAIIMNRKEAGTWAARARNQYQKPYIEPVTAH